MYPGWETFFDIDGTFIAQPYPTTEEDPISLDSNFLNSIVISESLNNSFSNVKNTTEVWGKCLETDWYTKTCTFSGNTYTAVFDNLPLSDDKGVPEFTVIGVKIPEKNVDSPFLKIVNKTKDPDSGEEEKYIETEIITLPIVGEDKTTPLPADVMKSENAYIFKYYKSPKEVFKYMGQFQIHYVVQEMSKEPTNEWKNKNIETYGTENIKYVINPDSPYCADRIGVKYQVFSGDEYDDIDTDDLARQRAEFENWKTTRLQDSVSLEVVAIPWLDVNIKVRYTSFITGETNDYIIKNVTGNSTSGTQTISMIKFYPYYPFVIE